MPGERRRGGQKGKEGGCGVKAQGRERVRRGKRKEVEREGRDGVGTEL